jgi:hypothetical protein
VKTSNLTILNLVQLGSMTSDCAWVEPMAIMRAWIWKDSSLRKAEALKEPMQYCWCTTDPVEIGMLKATGSCTPMSILKHYWYWADCPTKTVSNQQCQLLHA